MPSTRYCTHCGEPLEPGQQFCTRCGARVADAAGTAGPAGTPAPGTTAPQQVPQTQPEQARTQAQAPAQQPAAGSRRGSRGPMIVAVSLCCVATVILIGSVVLFVTTTQQSGGSTTQTTSQAGTSTNDDVVTLPDNLNIGNGDESEDPESTHGQGNANTGSSSANDAADEAFHTSLVSYYNALSDYDSRIRSVATDFNNHYLSGTISTRSSYANTAYGLLSELEQRQSALASLTMPSGSRYSSQYYLIAQCYDDCVNRVDCISRSWEIDLRYSNPKDHKNEILGPIAADNVNGTNRYKTDYDNTYPTISL